MNVASQKLVEKLKLVATPSPSPYTIQWLNQGKGIQVSSCCLASLSNGKTYKDEIWCDVIPMDACHVLLSRPWLFDRKDMHDGRMYTYSVFVDHEKMVMHPLALPNSLSQKKPSYSPPSSKLKVMSMSCSKNGSHLA